MGNKTSYDVGNKMIFLRLLLSYPTKGKERGAYMHTAFLFKMEVILIWSLARATWAYLLTCIIAIKVGESIAAQKLLFELNLLVAVGSPRAQRITRGKWVTFRLLSFSLNYTGAIIEICQDALHYPIWF